MLTPETYGLVIPWETDNPPTAHAVTHALRSYVPEDALIIHIETHVTPLRTELRVKYTFWGQQRPALDSRRGAGSGTGHVDSNATARRSLEQLINNLPEGARLTEMSVLSTDHRPDVAELAINFTYTPERTDR